MKLLDNVEYFTQRNNKYSPSVACFPTSEAVALHYIGVNDPYEGLQLEDYIVKECLNLSQEELNIIASVNGNWIFNSRPFQVIPIVEHVCKKIYKNTFLSWTISFEDIVSNIDKNHPVVCLGDFSSISYVKGHYNCIIGYDTETKSVWANDPWGNAHTNYKNYDGSQVLYDWSIFQVKNGYSHGLLFK
jgi:hypothetical protein